MSDKQPLPPPRDAQPTNPILRIISLIRVGPLAMLKRGIDQFVRKRTGRPLWSLSHIDEQLYVGGQHHPKGWPEMERKGITAVVNMREAHYDDQKLGIGGQRHLHLPTRDNTPPSIKSLEEGSRFIAEEIERGGKVYVHCGVGVGRAPAMVAAYFIHQGMSARDAIDHIKKTRPFVHLTYRQRKQLDAFATKVRQDEIDAAS